MFVVLLLVERLSILVSDQVLLSKNADDDALSVLSNDRRQVLQLVRIYLHVRQQLEDLHDTLCNAASASHSEDQWRVLLRCS